MPCHSLDLSQSPHCSKLSEFKISRHFALCLHLPVYAYMVYIYLSIWLIVVFYSIEP